MSFAFLFTLLQVDEGHRHVPLWPRKTFWRFSVDVGYTILQPTVVEGCRSEFSHEGMHTVLSVQEARPNPLRN
eukprot:Skav225044  [mRNA]  locus=scaffold2061:391235:392983:- [translate_table: standard]